MSKILKTSETIKKKMSFDDYNNTVSQQDVTPAIPLTSLPVDQQSILTAAQPTVMSTTEASMPAIPVSQRTSKVVRQHAAKKIKVTFYLTEEDNQVLTDIFIKKLQQKNKTDKSALISDAIRLLYKKEMK